MLCHNAWAQLLTAGLGANSLALGNLPLLLCILGPLCEAGEALALARSTAADLAYRGPWLEASAAQRRTLLSVMQASAWPQP